MSTETDQLLLPDADVSPEAVEENTPPTGRLDKFQLLIVLSIQIGVSIIPFMLFISWNDLVATVSSRANNCHRHIPLREPVYQRNWYHWR